MKEIMRQRIRYIVEFGGVFPTTPPHSRLLTALVVLVAVENLELLLLLLR
jgi:hypothetical protein